MFENGVTESELDTSAESIETARTDPTIANAGLTEIDAGTDIAMTNGHITDEPTEGVSGNAEVADEAANEAGENLATSQEWVEVKVPQDAPATEAEESAAPSNIGVAPMPAPAAPKESWAEEVADTTPEVRKMIAWLDTQVGQPSLPHASNN